MSIIHHLYTISRSIAYIIAPRIFSTIVHCFSIWAAARLGTALLEYFKPDVNLMMTRIEWSAQ